MRRVIRWASRRLDDVQSTLCAPVGPWPAMAGRLNEMEDQSTAVTMDTATRRPMDSATVRSTAVGPWPAMAGRPNEMTTAPSARCDLHACLMHTVRRLSAPPAAQCVKHIARSPTCFHHAFFITWVNCLVVALIHRRVVLVFVSQRPPVAGGNRINRCCCRLRSCRARPRRCRSRRCRCRCR